MFGNGLHVLTGMQCHQGSFPGHHSGDVATCENAV